MSSRAVCPAVLTGAAAAKWAELVATIEARPTSKPSTLVDLAAYCAAYGRWLAAEEWLAADGHGPVTTISDDKGNIRSHAPAPQLLISERASKEMARLARLLRI